MPKVARTTVLDRAPTHEGAEVRRLTRFQHRYYAFLSYSHQDKEMADWLCRSFERFRVPASLMGRLTTHGAIPKRLAPIFRDRQELAAADDLGEEILSALEASQFLIVLCSPAAAKSTWVDAEIDAFKRNRPEGCVLAALIAGEPFASDNPATAANECLPPALRCKYDRRGRPTGKKAEPLAADLRDSGDGRRMGFLKLVAGMLGVGLDELVRRETMRRQRRLGYLLAASLGGMAITSGLALTAIQARNAAREQRREAEGLVAFMLGDLKDKLEPIGRLDALDGVGSRILAYYQRQGTSDLSDAALSQRSGALSLMGQVAYLRGKMDGASRLYREAMTGTGEVVRRKPDDPRRLFDHAQNVYWIGEIAREQGHAAQAEAFYRQYKQLAQRMVALDPNSMKWRMEVQYAEANLGILLYEQRRFADAGNQFRPALQTIQTLAAADPRNDEYQKSFAETLAWLADTEMSSGHFGRALALREQLIGLLNRLQAQTSGDSDYREKLVPAEQALGLLYRRTGRLDLALQHLEAGVKQSQQMLAVENNNTVWLEDAFKARMTYAESLLAAGRVSEAAAQTRTACAIVGGLLQRDLRFPHWRAGLRDCDSMRASIAFASGAPGEASASARQAIEVGRTIRTSDPAADSIYLAKAYRLLGDAEHAGHDEAAARSAWRAAFAALPRGVAERPAEIGERALILQRVGQSETAAQMFARLAAIGYRNG